MRLVIVLRLMANLTLAVANQSKKKTTGEDVAVEEVTGSTRLLSNVVRKNYIMEN
jgi:hypothetical protein